MASACGILIILGLAVNHNEMDTCCVSIILLHTVGVSTPASNLILHVVKKIK